MLMDELSIEGVIADKRLLFFIIFFLRTGCASIYNAMSVEGVQKLITIMKQFEQERV